jgi:hypothetical protein
MSDPGGSTPTGAGEGGVELSEQDVDGFVQRLESWSEQLSPAEQGLLQLLVARAEAGAGSPEAAEPAAEGRSLGSVGTRAANLLRPMVQDSTRMFGMMRSGGAGYSSWGRG